MDLQQILFTDLDEVIRLQSELPPEYIGVSAVSLRHRFRTGKSFGSVEDFARAIELSSRRKDIELTLSRISMLLNDFVHEFKTEGDVTAMMGSGSIKSGTKMVSQNLLDIGGEMSNQNSAGVSQTLDMGQRNLLSLDDFFARPIPIYQGYLNYDEEILTTLNVWDLYSLVPSIRAKLRNYAFFKGTLHLRIMIAGTPYNYGRILASYQPYGNLNSTLVSYTTNAGFAQTEVLPCLNNYLSQAPGAGIIDIKENKPLDIECPFISVKPMFRLFNQAATAISDVTSYADFAEAGQLWLTSINKVKSIQDTNNLPIFVYAWMTGVELGTTTATQMAITTEGDVQVLENGNEGPGPIEAVSSVLVSVSNALVKVPIIGRYAKASGEFFKGIKAVAHLFGLSRPISLVQPQYMKNLGYQNGANTVGYDTSMKITMEPKQEVSIDPSPVGTSTDDLSIMAIASRESYFHTFTWAVEDASLAGPIFKMGVAPRVETLSGTHSTFTIVQPTALAFAALPFAYWHGKITYRMEIVCSVFHRGKIAIYFEPNIAQNVLIDADLSTNKQYMKVIDIQETQSVDFCVDWAMPFPWAYTSSRVALDGTITPSDTLFATYNGYIGIVPIVPLVSPDEGSIEINLYVKAEDIKFNFFNSEYFPNRRRIFTEGDVSQLSSQPVDCVPLNSAELDEDHLIEYCFGEIPVSFRTLLKRYVGTTAGGIDFAADAALVKRISYAAPVYPAANPLYTTATTSTTTNCLYNYLRYAYVGLRGGMRHRIYMFVDGTMSPALNTIAQINAPGVSTITPAVGINTITTALGYSRSQTQGSVVFNNASNGGIEVEIPYYNPNLFLLSFRDNLATTSANTQQNLFLRGFAVNFAVTGATAAGVMVDEISTAEDFSFMRFQGAPYYTV